MTARRYPKLRCPYCRQFRPSYLYRAHVNTCEVLRLILEARMRSLSEAEFDRLAALWLLASRGPVAVSHGGETFTVCAVDDGAPRVGQRVQHSGVTWIVDTIYGYGSMAKHYDCDIVRGCCLASVTIPANG